MADELLQHWLHYNSEQQKSVYTVLCTRQTEACASSVVGKKMAFDTIHVVREGSRRAKHAWLWQPEGAALSDTLLRIQHLPNARGETAEQLEAKSQNSVHKEEYRLHSVVLAAGSDYFKLRLLNRGKAFKSDTPTGRTATIVPVQTHADASGLRHPSPSATSALSTSSQRGSDHEDEEEHSGSQFTQQPLSAASTDSVQRPTYFIEERLAPSDTSAAKAVLRHIYTEQLTFESPCQLVSILKIADKWKAQDTIDAGRAAFSQLKPEDLDLDVIKQVYSLDGMLRDAQNFADLVNMVQNRLVTMFQDIVEVVQNPSSRNMFQQLPLAAVLALLRSPQLIVDSEDTVVVAANLWVTGGKGRNTTPDQRRILAGVINLAALSPAYLCGVLPNLRWFTPQGQSLVSWAQVLPGPYYAELQMRLVSPKARQVLTNSSSPGDTSGKQGPLPSTSAADAGRSSRNGSTSLQSPANARSQTSSNGSKPAQQAASRGSSSGGGARSTAPESPTTTGALERTNSLPWTATGRIVREQNLEIECDIDFTRLKQYIEDGYNGMQGSATGFRGIHVHSQCSYFKGFMWGIKLVFGYSPGHAPDGPAPTFTVTPSPFASLPPGEDGIRPLNTPINVSFRCTIEGVASDKVGTYATATYQGASFLRPGEEHVSSIGIANFFKRVPQQHLPDSWVPYLVENAQKQQFLRLRLRVLGTSVE